LVMVKGYYFSIFPNIIWMPSIKRSNTDFQNSMFHIKKSVTCEHHDQQADDELIQHGKVITFGN
jgi:hypothetical protein